MLFSTAHPLLNRGAQEISEPKLSQVSENLYLKLELEEKVVKTYKVLILKNILYSMKLYNSLLNPVEF